MQAICSALVVCLCMAQTVLAEDVNAGDASAAPPARPTSAGFTLVDHWGLRAASPAVVNAATSSPLQQILSLRGKWEFVTDPRLMGRHRMGKGPEWNEPDWTGGREIEVPGCWEAQGVGEPGMSSVWDMAFDCIPRPLKHVYMGTARFRRAADIPKDWDGKRIWLKVGGVRTEAWIWVNKQRVAHINTYCGAYKYDVTDFVKPGQPAEVVATVRNDTPSRTGCMAAFHRFGGFYRDIEFEATPATRIDDVYVRGDLDKKAAIVNVSIRCEDKTPLRDAALQIALRTLDGKPAGELRREVTLDPDGNADAVCEIPLADFRPWTPETPNLYLADVTLVSGGATVHGWTERFGLRKLEVRGKRFFLNGKPFFVRGFGDDYIYPDTLISPPDREEHLKHLRTARAAGFNYVRHHTHCEIPEFFDAADEAGILVQPELPYYHDIATEGAEWDPMRDIQELYRHRRRHVSFAAYSLGNEGHLGSPMDRELYQWAKRTDPDRIFQHQDGGCNTADNADFFTPNGYGLASSIMPWEPGTFDSLGVPFIAHEYLNLGIKMDPRDAPKFTGAIPSPRTLEAYQESLGAAGLPRAWGDACLNSAHTLQAYYQKRGLEQARLDPACDGYSFWTIVDVMVPQEGTFTGQGFLNAFWEQKRGGLAPREFGRFNGPTVILAKCEADDAVAVAGDTRQLPLWLSHFGSADLRQARLSWRLIADGKSLVNGTLPPFDASTGEVKQVGVCEFTVPALVKPAHAKLEASIDGAGTANTWDFWLFPKPTVRDGAGIAVTQDLFDVMSKRYSGIVKAGTEQARTARVVVGSWDHPDLLQHARNGQPCLMIGPAEGEPNVKLGWWILGEQIGTAFADHPAFGDFPHNGTMSPLWFRLIKQGIPLPIDPKFGEYNLLAVGEGKRQYYAHIWEKKDKEGQRMLLTRGVDLLADTPEGAWLTDAMIRYVQGDGFQKSWSALPRGSLQ